MKDWLIWLYPLSWRRRYGEEFSALLDQQPLTLHVVIDVVRGAFDAHWRSPMLTGQELQISTFTIRIRRRTVYGLLTLLLLYGGSYGVVRGTGQLVHKVGNRYTGVSNHYVQVPSYALDPANPYPTLEVVYYPLRIAESISWPLIDSVYQPSS